MKECKEKPSTPGPEEWRESCRTGNGSGFWLGRGGALQRGDRGEYPFGAAAPVLGVIRGLERGNGQEKFTSCVEFSELGCKSSVAVVVGDEVLGLPVGTAAILLALPLLGGDAGKGPAGRGLAGADLA